MTSVAPTGEPIGLLIRNSTRLQIGNYRSEVQYDMVNLLASRGFAPRVYDEQGTSGSNLSTRKVTLRMLDDVDRGELRGIAAEDIKRLTRDEFGIDGAQIAKRLSRAGAILVTRDNTYDLTLESDITAFQIQCLMSGIEWRGIRNTFWSGLVKAWEKGPLFLRPAIGYCSEYVNVEGRSRPVARPARNTAHAQVMVELIEAFDSCTTLAGVVRRLNERGVKRPAVTYRGEPFTGWTVQGLRYMLHNPIYTGVFSMGGNETRAGKRRSVIWRRLAADGSGGIRTFTHVVPELAYWAPSKARAWRAKFEWKHAEPKRRERKYPHALLGMLECYGCGSLMIGNGPHGYVCGKHLDCPHAQKTNERVVVVLLRTVLADTLSRVGDLARLAEQELGSDRPSDDALRLAALEQRSQEVALLCREHPSKVLAIQLEDMEGEMNSLRERIADEQAEREQQADLRLRLRVLQDRPLDVFERLTPAEQARFYTLLFRRVRIGSEGRAGARRWWLEAYVPVFDDVVVHVGRERSAIARVMPFAQARKLGQDDPLIIDGSTVVSMDCPATMASYLSSLSTLSGALLAA
jgi:DNA invertase Pin-like site-specific DNA recombinase